jgi:hypothetical protein
VLASPFPPPTGKAFAKKTQFPAYAEPLLASTSTSASGDGTNNHVVRNCLVLISLCNGKSLNFTRRDKRRRPPKENITIPWGPYTVILRNPALMIDLLNERIVMWGALGTV